MLGEVAQRARAAPRTAHTQHAGPSCVGRSGGATSRAPPALRTHGAPFDDECTSVLQSAKWEGGGGEKSCVCVGVGVALSPPPVATRCRRPWGAKS
eukprot:scaffold257973_cov31-Tisochrysis_lutea.AAC.4